MAAAIHHPQTIQYSAEWAENLTPLNPETRSLCQKIYDFFLNALLFVPKLILTPIFTRSIIPATSATELEIRTAENTLEQIFDEQLRGNFTMEPIEVRTPDGAEIHGNFFQNRRHIGEDIPTILLFNPNASYVVPPNIDLLLNARDCDVPFNVVSFDYRGIGRSRGEATPEGFILDGASIYQFVNEHLGISEENIDFYGFSLGGGVASAVKAVVAPHSGGKLIIDRSFNALRNAIKAIIRQSMNLPNLIADIAAYLAYLIHWDLDNERAVSEIEDPRCIFNIHEDPIIGEEGLSFSVTPRLRDEILTVSADHIEEGENAHCIPTPRLRDENGRNMQTRVFEFIAKNRAIRV